MMMMNNSNKKNNKQKKILEDAVACIAVGLSFPLVLSKHPLGYLLVRHAHTFDNYIP